MRYLFVVMSLILFSWAFSAWGVSCTTDVDGCEKCYEGGKLISEDGCALKATEGEFLAIQGIISNYLDSLAQQEQSDWVTCYNTISSPYELSLGGDKYLGYCVEINLESIASIKFHRKSEEVDFVSYDEPPIFCERSNIAEGRQCARILNQEPHE